MIENIEISGIHLNVDDDLKRYITKKIGRIDRYLPRHARNSMRAEVVLKESKHKNKKQCTCEVILRVPHDVIMVSESTLNMYAAVDIVEVRIKNQLKKYKELHSSLRLHRRLLARLRRNA